ncbi:hypothetical protein A2U01_0063130 [Trifolium medium]|uniref:Uncharacterized protein n=1 Tax=Trifolium medium TaxID=97028 RepID=A0A392S219_9FABA|nr:hypothetical protein [Trifolium medium]
MRSTYPQGLLVDPLKPWRSEPTYGDKCSLSRPNTLKRDVYMMSQELPSSTKILWTSKFAMLARISSGMEEFAAPPGSSSG